MKFRGRPVVDPLAQLNFEQLEGLLALLPHYVGAVPDGQKIVWNMGAIAPVWNGAVNTIDTVIAHGLGTTPVVALATSTSGASFWAETFAKGVTNFTLRLSYGGLFVAQIPVAGNYGAEWLAVGIR